MGRELAPELSQELQITQHHSQINENGVNVVLTAFEPFCLNGIDVTNMNTACWESVRLLPDRGISFARPVNIYCYQLRNIYDFIAKQIGRCWEKHDPDLLVVVGRHGLSDHNCLVFEEIANSTHDLLLDQQQRLSMDSCFTRFGPKVLQTTMDLQDVAEKLCAANTGLMGKTARNSSGFYLCDYAYYHSLFNDVDRSACIRVPDGEKISSEDLADGLAFCIAEMLQQLEDRRLLKNRND